MGVIAESIAVLQIVASGLLGAISDQSGRAGAEVRRATGAMQASAEASLRLGSIGDVLGNCFDLTRQAGATMDGFEAVRLAALSTRTTADSSRAVAQAAARFALIEQCSLISDLVLTSRNDVDRYLARINAGFDAAEESAADSGEADVYRALVSLRASTVRDLLTRARPLPRMTAYDLARSLPALTLANRIYGDAGRADELHAENKVVHPLFMPAAGRAFSA